MRFVRCAAKDGSRRSCGRIAAKECEGREDEMKDDQIRGEKIKDKTIKDKKKFSTLIGILGTALGLMMPVMDGFQATKEIRHL